MPSTRRNLDSSAVRYLSGNLCQLSL